MEPEEKMTDAQLDAELRSYGIEPERVLSIAFQRVCELAKKQSAELATLRSENERLKAQVTTEELLEEMKTGEYCRYVEHAQDYCGCVNAKEAYDKLLASRTQATQKGSE